MAQFIAAPRATSLRGERISPAEAGESMLDLVGPMGIAGTIRRVAKRMFRGKGAKVAQSLAGSNPEQALLPSELTRLRLLSNTERKLTTTVAGALKQGSKTAKTRQDLTDLDDISEEIQRLLTTAQNRFGQR